MQKKSLNEHIWSVIDPQPKRFSSVVRSGSWKIELSGGTAGGGTLGPNGGLSIRIQHSANNKNEKAYFVLNSPSPFNDTSVKVNNEIY